MPGIKINPQLSANSRVTMQQLSQTSEHMSHQLSPRQDEPELRIQYFMMHNL